MRGQVGEPWSPEQGPQPDRKPPRLGTVTYPALPIGPDDNPTVEESKPVAAWNVAIKTEANLLEDLATLVVIGALATFCVDLVRLLAPTWFVFDKIHYVLAGLLVGGFAWCVREVRRWRPRH